MAAAIEYYNREGFGRRSNKQTTHKVQMEAKENQDKTAKERVDGF